MGFIGSAISGASDLIDEMSLKQKKTKKKSNSNKKSTIDKIRELDGAGPADQKIVLGTKNIVRRGNNGQKINSDYEAMYTKANRANTAKNKLPKSSDDIKHDMLMKKRTTFRK
jgi:hypothetical protein